MSEPAAPRPFIIGVAGGSSSGQDHDLGATRRDDRARSRVADRTRLLLPGPQRPAARGSDGPSTTTIPDAFDWPLLNDHLAALANGASVPVPVYDYALDNRSGEVRIVEPSRIIVVDGILVLWDRALRDRFDLKIFVDTAADVRLIRRLRRDIAERGRSAESVIEQYLDHGEAGPRTIHRAEQAVRRRDHPRGRSQPSGARRAARPGAGDHRRLSLTGRTADLPLTIGA